MFHMFVNMFWRALGFGYAWVPYEFGSFNNLCVVFSLDYQKTNLIGQKQKNTFWLRAYYLLKIIEKIIIKHHHCRAVAGSRLRKKDKCYLLYQWI